MRGEVWLAGMQGARETRLTPSKETCRLRTMLYIISKYSFYSPELKFLLLLSVGIDNQFLSRGWDAGWESNPGLPYSRSAG